MFIKNFATTALIATAFLADPVFCKFKTLKWHSKTTCADSGGPWRHYNEGECRTLYNSDHGVAIWSTSPDCYVYAYESNNCKGNRHRLNNHSGGNQGKCNSLQGQWSIKVVC
ncbi:hypothetical protein Q7P37_006047 [Cladosporium fusiforme]